MNSEKTFSKVDETLLKIVKEVSDGDSTLEVILIGGRATNLLVNENRYSIDSDVALRDINGNTLSTSRVRNFARKVRKKIETDFGMAILRAESNEDETNFKFKRQSFYRVLKYLVKIYLFINEEYHILELSNDETIDSIDAGDSYMGIKIAPLDYMLAVKVIISAKKIDNNSIYENSNFRHLYDIVRLIDTDLWDIENIIKQLELLHKYETIRPSKQDYKFELEIHNIPMKIIEWLKSNLKKEEFDQSKNKVLKTNADLMFSLNEKEYENEFSAEAKISLINFLEKLNSEIEKRNL